MAEIEQYHRIQHSKNDPHVQKLLEMIYMNVSKRFQVFGNAYCYLDFKNRQRVSLSDFIKGLDGFALKITPADAKLVFRYLTDTQDQEPGDPEPVFMTQDQFMKLKTESKTRKIDPFEL